MNTVGKNETEKMNESFLTGEDQKQLRERASRVGVD
jgi:hypothetical protein